MPNRRVYAYLLACTCATVSNIAATASAAEEQICRYHEHGVWAAPGDTAAPTNGRHYAPDRNVDIDHIHIDVTPDFQKHTVQGTTTITFIPIAKPLAELKLDAVDLQVSDVSSPTATIADHSSTKTHLTILFDPPIAAGTKTDVSIRYTAEPVKGLYFRTAKMGYAETDTHLWTQGEPHEARHWFPCYDYPNERSSTSVTCHVPADMTVLSNGELVSETVDADSGRKAVRWYQEKPHVNYLICLVAGYLNKLEDQHANIPLALYTQPSLFEHAQNSFADTAEIMAFYEQEIGVPFPWKKYYQVTIRDFMWGGMENTSLTTLTENTIFDKASETLRTTRRLDAHEMAHQWFGDYVTCKDWSQLWLNEGFATFYTHLYEGHKFGNDAKLYGLYEDATNSVLSNSSDKKPIVYRQYDEPKQQFDYRAYPKGSWVLHMLRSQLGEDLYRECIKTYLERNALTSVVTADLNRVIEELSGRSFDQFFDQYVFHARHPDLRIRYEWLPKEKLAHLTVQQTHEVNGDVLLFHIPSKFRFIIGEETIDQDIEISRPKHDFYFPLGSQPTIVRFDPDYTVLANVDFDKPDKMLLAQISNESDMIGRVLAAKQLGHRKTDESAAALKKALNEDKFFGVRIEASKSLGDINNDTAFQALNESRVQEDARVRDRVITDISRFFRPEARTILLDVAATEANPEIVSRAIEAMGRYHDEQTRKAIRDALRSTSFQNRTADAAVRAIRHQNDPMYAQSLMRVLRERDGEFTTSGLGSALRTLGTISRQRADKTEVREFISDYLTDLREPLRVSAIRALGELGDPQARSALEILADDDRSDRVTSAAKAALKKLDDQTPAVPGELAQLRTKLRELTDEQDRLRDQVQQLINKASQKDEE
ncbi:MAG: HEAT repeat domain-containing protein [Planctomycetales bacterium]|nr:HEAT repeat domain-containing protein [Planctomycetales bacterium]